MNALVFLTVALISYEAFVFIKNRLKAGRVQKREAIMVARWLLDWNERHGTNTGIQYEKLMDLLAIAQTKARDEIDKEIFHEKTSWVRMPDRIDGKYRFNFTAEEENILEGIAERWLGTPKAYKVVSRNASSTNDRQMELIRRAKASR